MTMRAGLIRMSLSALQTKANAGAGLPTHDPAFSWLKAYADGTGAAEFEDVYDAVTSMTSLSVNTFELGGMTNPFGAALVFTTIKALVVYNAGDVAFAVGGGLGFACPSVPAGGWFGWATPDATGIAVGANPNDELVITNGSGTGSVRIIICGH